MERDVTSNTQEFSHLMQAAYAIIEKAKRVPGISDIQFRQANAAAGLAGTTFHKISIAYPDASDANAVRADVLAIARLTDPLILAVGEHLAENFSGVDLDQFRDQVLGAVEGNATHECDEAARRSADALAEDAPLSPLRSEHSTLNRVQQGA
jgi:hypothetical protein